MATSKSSKRVTPEKIMRISWAAAETMILCAATQLDLFTQIANGKKSAKEIARAAKTAAGATERLLNALVGLELLKKDGETYQLQPDAETFLVRGQPGYLGEMILMHNNIFEHWKSLPQAVTTGNSAISVNTQTEGEPFFIKLVRALYPGSFSTAVAAAAHLKKRGQQIGAILDVAAGSGAWSLGFHQLYPEARVTVIDFPAVLDVTREFVAQNGAESQYEYLSGDQDELNFGKNRYDLIILGHICHSEGLKRTRRLIKKSAQALRPGGSLLICEMLPNDERSGPLFPLMFSLNMLLFTKEGDVFTISEFRDMTAAAGLAKFEILDRVPAVSPLLLATK